jgi:ribonuclease E
VSTSDKPARQNRERTDGRRGRGRRGERPANSESQENLPATEDNQSNDASHDTASQADHTTAAEHGTQAPQGERVNERRERRGRERPGRERQARSQVEGESSNAHSSHAQEASPASHATAPPTPVAASMPKIAAFDLPLAQLQQVAQSSGLEWVNSNPERIAQIQAAIAAEPRPVHVPRERPAPVVLDEGPLILVETKKDLSQMHMPFENA